MDSTALWAIAAMIASLAVAYYFYRKARPNPRVCFVWSTVHLTSGKSQLPEEVQVVYRGQPVPEIAQTELLIWNGGNATLRSSDLVTNDPLRLRFGDGFRVLRADIVDALRPVTQFQVTAIPDQPSEVRLAFEFLEPNDGARIRVLHTGHRGPPKALGTVIGVRQGIENRGTFAPGETVAGDIGRWVYLSVFVFVPCLMGAAYGLAAIIAAYSDVNKPLHWPSVIAALLLLGLGTLHSLSERRRYPRVFLAKRQKKGPQS